jgi:ribosomal protein S27AE
MAQTNKMICPKCGVEMNHHAMKVDYGASLDNPTAIDPLFGGVLQEAHTCPECGTTELRGSN